MEMKLGDAKKTAFLEVRYESPEGIIQVGFYSSRLSHAANSLMHPVVFVYKQFELFICFFLRDDTYQYCNASQRGCP